MKPNIRFFDLLRSTNKAFPTWVVSISTNVPADFALGRVIPWARVYIDLEPHLRSRCAMANLHRVLMC